ncbi:MAG: 3-ketoacyl-ACP reductase [Planctomycetota bacterium]
MSRAIALITGGSRGIGLGVAQELARSGFDVAITGRRPAEDAGVAQALASLEAHGGRAAYFASDVADLDQHEPLLDAVESALGGLDVLVNNAGVAPDVRADILEADAASFDRLISINLRGPYFLTQRAARRLVERRKAQPESRCSVVFVGSISADIASINRGDYCLSKAGIGMAAKLFATRLGEHGIPVYEVRPGIIATDMTAGVQEKYEKLFADGLAIEHRWGTPEDVGKAVAALARGDFPYATGQHIMIDGGLSTPRL